MLSRDRLAFVHKMDDSHVIDYIPLAEIEEVGTSTLGEVRNVARCACGTIILVLTLH